MSPRYLRDRWEGFLTQDYRGMMMIEGVPIDVLIKKYGTPLYVMVESEIRRRLRRFKKVFGPNIGLQYAVKCNSNLEILRIVREEGFELDCSSVGEIILGLLADFKPRQLTLTNVFKTQQDLNFMASLGIQAVTADSVEELEHICKTARKLRKHVKTVIRVNPMLQMGSYNTKENKYGVPVGGQLDRAVEMAHKSPYVDFQGFHFMGGYVHTTKIYDQAARLFLKQIKRYYDRGVRIKSLSLGGGFPAAIGEEEAFAIEAMSYYPEFFENLRQSMGLPPVRLIFEPGKSIVMNSGIGLTKVLSRKRLGTRKRIIIADTSTYNFVPDALIQHGIRYDILPASRLKSPRVHKITVAGNTCDSWDIIAKDVEMPKLRAGDYLSVMDVGGYAYVMANNFNTLKRSSMIMIYQDGSSKLIRRRDRYSEMFAPELDVLKMAGPNELEKYNNMYRVNIDKIWKGSQKKNGAENGSNGHGSGKRSRQPETILTHSNDLVHQYPKDIDVEP